MLEYYGDEEATRAAFTDDGFYLTGDIAEISADGWIRYMGRKKDVINSSEGSNIFPAPMEQQLEAVSWIQQALLLGDGRPTIAALLVIDDASGNGSPGHLSPTEFPDYYERARIVLNGINADVEKVSRIGRVVLFSTSMPEGVYFELGVKQRRNRRKGARGVSGITGYHLWR